jgi:hypothetical protein
MPVVYVAVGRRLGYPLKLVEARKHLLFRWDDARGTFLRWPNFGECWIPPDRFNVEGSGEGIAYRADSHYMQWPQLWTEVDFSHGRYLRSLNPAEELAAFLVQRGECFWDLGRCDEAMKAYFFARKLAPDDSRYEWLHAKRTHEYDVQMHRQLQLIADRNQRAGGAMGARQCTVPGRVLKIAYGTPIPPGLPPGTAIRYVSADLADPLPEEIAATSSQANRLPPGYGPRIASKPKTMIDWLEEQRRGFPS